MMTFAPLQILARRRRMGDGGMPLVEFALIVPVLMTMALGMVEVGTYALLTLKLQNTASNLANLATRDTELSQTTVDDIMTSARTSMAPFNLGPEAAFLVSSVAADGQGGNTIAWQRSGGGTMAASSQIGSPGGAADLPPGVSLGDETLIIVEAFYDYQERLLGFVPSTTVYRAAFFRPRYGALAAPQ